MMKMYLYGHKVDVLIFKKENTWVLYLSAIFYSGITLYNYKRFLDVLDNNHGSMVTLFRI